jgi:hypothetical protein
MSIGHDSGTSIDNPAEFPLKKRIVPWLENSRKGEARMALVGFLLQMATVALMGYLGYTFQLEELGEMHYIIFAASPLGFIIGHLMRKSSRRSTPTPGGFMEKVSAFVSSYLVCLILSALCFGAGFALMHILEQRPPPGIGRY